MEDDDFQVLEEIENAIGKVLYYAIKNSSIQVSKGSKSVSGWSLENALLFCGNIFKKTSKSSVRCAISISVVKLIKLSDPLEVEDNLPKITEIILGFFVNDGEKVKSFFFFFFFI